MQTVSRKNGHSRLAVVLGFVALISACGGGGGSGSPEVTDFPVESTFTEFFSKPRSYVMSAKDQNGNNYSFTYQITPGEDRVVPELSADPLKVTQGTVSISANGSTPVTETGELYYTTAPFFAHGTSGAVGADVPTTKNPAPTTAKVGDSGVLTAGPVTYLDNGVVVTLSSTTSWALERDSSSTAWLCMISSTSMPSTERTCARINKDGVIDGFKSTVTIAGVALEFR